MEETIDTDRRHRGGSADRRRSQDVPGQAEVRRPTSGGASAEETDQANEGGENEAEVADRPDAAKDATPAGEAETVGAARAPQKSKGQGKEPQGDRQGSN